MMPFYLVGSEIPGKIYWTMKYRSQRTIKIYEATRSVKLN